MKVTELSTPALVLYLDKVKANADHMLEKSKEYKVKLRPHFKTTKAVEAAVLQTGGTKRCMAVSTLPEAELLAENDFDDILLACPLPTCRKKLSRCAVLNEKLSQFHLMVDQVQHVDVLVQFATERAKKWSVFISVDCGYHREGVPPDQDEMMEMARRLHQCQYINIQGLYTHNGHSYYADGRSDIVRIANNAVNELLLARERLKSIGVNCDTYGLGSTPVCLQPTESMRKLTEWHPGCYVINDLQQQMLGGCKMDEIAAVVLTQIVGHYKSSSCQHLLVDCGWTALTLQGQGKFPSGGYGSIVNHPGLKLESMTQELGKVVSVDGSPLNFEEYPIGSTLRIYPYHACATCSMHSVYYVANSKDDIVGEWKPARGW